MKITELFFENTDQKRELANELLSLIDQDYDQITVDHAKRAIEISKVIGRNYTVKNGVKAGWYVDFIKDYARKNNHAAGNPTVVDKTSKTVPDFAKQLAMATNGKYIYEKGWRNLSGTKDADDYVEYQDQESLDDALEYIKKMGKLITYDIGDGYKKQGFQIGKFIVEPNYGRGAFSSGRLRLAVRTTSIFKSSKRKVIELTPQQADWISQVLSAKNLKVDDMKEKVSQLLVTIQAKNESDATIDDIINRSKSVDANLRNKIYGLFKNPNDQRKIDDIIKGSQNFKDTD
jgi:hypothetical protein